MPMLPEPSGLTLKTFKLNSKIACFYKLEWHGRKMKFLGYALQSILSATQSSTSSPFPLKKILGQRSQRRIVNREPKVLKIVIWLWMIGSSCQRMKWLSVVGITKTLSPISSYFTFNISTHTLRDFKDWRVSIYRRFLICSCIIF